MGWGYERRGWGWSPLGGILVLLGVILLFSKIGIWWLLFPLFFIVGPLCFCGGWGHRHRNRWDRGEWRHHGWGGQWGGNWGHGWHHGPHGHHGEPDDGEKRKRGEQGSPWADRREKRKNDREYEVDDDGGMWV